MKLFPSRADSASPLPADYANDLDLQMQTALQQAYAVESVSPQLRQRVADMAALHEQQTVMQKPVRWPRRTAFALGGVAVLLCFTCLFSLYIRIYRIPSASMEPTLMGHEAGLRFGGATYTDPAHDWVLVNKGAYNWSAPQIGDIVVFMAPLNADAEHRYKGVQHEYELVKRIVGLPGDTIEFNGGHIFRNSEALKEPYLAEPMNPYLEPQFNYATNWRGGPLKLGENEYWMMGDNRNDSNDSRYWGALERKRIMGKVSLIIAPFERLRWFP